MVLTAGVVLYSHGPPTPPHDGACPSDVRKVEERPQRKRLVRSHACTSRPRGTHMGQASHAS